MSTLDQAFIRAYQAKPAGGMGNKPRAAETPAEASRRPVAMTTMRIDAAHDAPPPEAPRDLKADTRRHFVDAAHHGLPPHYAEEARQVVAASEDRVRARRPVVVAEAAIDRDDTLPAAAEVFRPAFETRRFAWPRHVEVLIAAAGNEFAEFVAELESRAEAGRKSLVVTGVERGEGRTTLVLALARLAANRGLRTAIVDFDVRNPQLAEQLGIRPELGWDDMHSEHLTPAEVMIESLDDGISLLPMRHALANPRSLAGNAVSQLLIEELREHFDLILFDVGPLTDDEQTIDAAASIGGSKLEDALVVRDRRRIGAKQVHEVCRRLGVLGIRHWDIAENFTEVQGYES